MNNNTVIALSFVIILMLSVKLHCTNSQLNKQLAEVSQLENKFATLEADRILTLDSVDVLNNTLEAERMALTNRLDGYKMKPTKERIKLITLIDTFAIPTDTGAILSLFGVDSINTLAISYQSCVIQSATKDTIITHLTTSNLQADTLLANKDTIIKTQSKMAKKANRLVKVWQGVSYALSALTVIILITSK
jgi:hypothetical protein